MSTILAAFFFTRRAGRRRVEGQLNRLRSELKETVVLGKETEARLKKAKVMLNEVKAMLNGTAKTTTSEVE
jgi:hypothetical protein